MTALPYGYDANEDHDNAKHNIRDGTWIPAGLRTVVLRQIWHRARATFTNIHDDFRAGVYLVQP